MMLHTDLPAWMCGIPVLISFPLGLLCIRSVYPFWEQNPTVRYKAFVHRLFGMFYVALGLLLILAKYKLISSLVPAPYASAWFTASWMASIPAFALGGYYFYVAKKIDDRNAGQTLNPTEEAAELAKATTGRLSNEQDLMLKGCHVNDGYFLGTYKEKPIFLNNFVHVITYGGPGSGKSVSCVIPNILNWPHSMFITDPKGELSVMTADHRRALGQEVIFLNPWELLGVANTPYNPLQILLKDVRNTANAKADRRLKEREVVDARVIAQVLIPEPKVGDQNKWVRDGARQLLEAFMLYFAVEKPAMCSLIGLQRALSYSDVDYVAALDGMRASAAFRNVLASYGNSLANSYTNEPQQHANYRSEAVSALAAYIPFGPMGNAVSIRATFDMERFVKRPTTIFLTVPGEQREAYQSWMRLVVTIAVETVGRYGDNNTPCLFMLDEFANMGRLANIQKGLAEYRGNGFRGWLIVQDREQLATVYPDGESKALENLCEVEQILSCKFDHAKELSERLGKTGIKKTTILTSREIDRGYGSGQKNEQYEGKPILEPKNIIDLGSKQLVFVTNKSLDPILLDKCPYWHADPWSRQVAPNPIEQRFHGVTPSAKVVIPQRGQSVRR